MAQFVTRMSDELAAAVDEAVASGEANNRSELVRKAVIELLERRRREAVARQTIAAYRRQPQTKEETSGIDAAGREMIAEEPW